MINIQTNLTTGAHVRVHMPDLNQISVAPVRVAVEKVQGGHAALTVARRELQAATEGVPRAREAAKQQAGDAKRAGEDKPKGLLKQVAAAEEVVEEARLELHAVEAMLDSDYRTLKAVVEANAPALRAAALKDAERAINLLAESRKRLENADREATAAFGILAMLATAAIQSNYSPVLGATPQLGYVEKAMEQLGPAIGDCALKLEDFRRG